MANELDPLVSQWYAYKDKGQRFFVTAIDDAEGTVDVQHFDGDVEEFSLEAWRELNIELCEEPENWAAPFDVAEQDDLGTEISDTTQEDWAEPQREFRSPNQEKLSPEPEAPTDDYGEGYMEEKPLE